MAEAIAYVEGQHNKISSIVDRFLFLNTLPNQWFQWALEVALWDLRELKLDVAQGVKTELLPVTDRKTVLVPPCFVDWVKIGAPCGQYVITASVNDALNLLPREPNSTNFVAGLASQNLPNGINFANYGGYYFLNYNGSSLPAIGGGFITKGSFKLHDAGLYKEILLDYDYPFTHLYIEYIGEGIDLCGETVVDPYFCDYVYKSIEAFWEEKKNPSRTEASIFRKGQDKYFAMKVVRARKNNLDPKTLLNISRAQVRLTPHF